MAKITHPPLLYFGGKWRVAPKIMKWFPPHKIYVEPFGGAASILLRKDPSCVDVYNDIDSDAVNFFRILRDHSGDLLHKLYFTPYSREEYIYIVRITTVMIQWRKRVCSLSNVIPLCVQEE